jgi:hypothetical protein
MRADYKRDHEETIATSLQIVSFFKTFEEIEGDFRLFDSYPEGMGEE